MAGAMFVSKPSIGIKEKRLVNKALEKGDVCQGEYISQFEKDWANWNGKQFGVSCNSGTSAIYLALKALGVGPGDEVIVPEYTMIATAWAVTYTGARPVFVDCSDYLLMDNTKIKKKVTEKTKAIITVPIYGRKAITPRILGLPIIEDMAEAHGIKPRGDISCYSFYGNKILTTGEGGMCVTDNGNWANEMRRLSNMYMDDKRSMIHEKVAGNFRMTNLQAALGVAQVSRIEEILLKRKQIEKWYDKNIPEYMKMPKRDVLWMYDIQTEKQEELKAYLKRHGIETRYGFKPMSQQPMYEGEYKSLNAYKWSKKILYLPTWTDMKYKDVKKVCNLIQSFEKK